MLKFEKQRQREVDALIRAGGGRWCVAVKRNGRFWSISRDHRWLTKLAAAQWVVANRCANERLFIKRENECGACD